MVDEPFCRICGSPKKDVPTGRFSGTTGKPTTRKVCAADECHDGHDYEYKKGSWFCGKYVCRRCNHVMSSEDY